MSADPVILVPYGVDPLPLLANRLLDRHAAGLPDLSDHVALFPHAGPARRFRRVLLAAARERGIEALLPPWCGTLVAWLAHTESTPLGSVLKPAARELILLHALSTSPSPTMRLDPWSIVDTVLPLFDELTHYATALPDARAGLRELLGHDYGTQDTTALDHETDWLYSFWRAWRTHLEDHTWRDPAVAHVTALDQSLKTLPTTAHVYVAPDPRIPSVEVRWLKALYRRAQLTLLLQGRPRDGLDYHPDRPASKLLSEIGLRVTAPTNVDPVTELLDSVYESDGEDLRARSRAMAVSHPLSPLRGRLASFAAENLEHEARAVDLQIRRWRLSGLRNIAIVTHDRKLARRVRALLERANLALHDAAGWALSTTSAATVLARWIDCCEQNFAYRPLLDVLKSPFVDLNIEAERYDAAVRALEHGVIRRYRVHRGLARYRRAEERASPQTDSSTGATLIGELLDAIAVAAEPLHRWFRPGYTATPSTYFTNLQESLTQLGARQRLQNDPAGREVLAAIDTLRTMPSAQHSTLDYASFRRWFEREMERRRFRPNPDTTDIRLLTPTESAYDQFDAVVLAGCTADQLPGTSSTVPFLNEAVRARLTLPSLSDRLSCGLYDFRRLLQAAPYVLVTYRCSDAREPLLPSPWFERVTAFHELAYGPLSDDGLGELLSHPESLLTQREIALGSPVDRPAPAAPIDLLPGTWSASSHQRLVDCPYQFYAADMLGLRQVEAVPEEIERSHYGERVHRILHAFHSGVRGLPGPFRGSLPADRATADTLLREISHAAFSMEMDSQFSARAWYSSWQSTIPAYLDWLDQHWRQGVNSEASELKVERTIYIDGRPLVLRGRIDRVDRGHRGKIVIDYKTGQNPALEPVLTGEQVQLGFYVLLLAVPVEAALYLALRGSTPAEQNLTGDALTITVNRLIQRIETIANALAAGAKLPAWGDPQTCGRCHFEGVCRRGLWDGRQ